MYFSKIIATGSYLPQKILTNDDLSHMVDTSDEWIRTRTGIKTRHIAADNQQNSDLAFEASINALNKFNLKVEDIDGIIVATSTPDLLFPSMASILQRKLGIKKCFSFDMQAVCSGFVYALHVADSMIRANRASRILVVGSEIFSRIVNWKDRNTCVLFGDGAGCVILEKTEENPLTGNNPGILDSEILSDGSFTDDLRTTEGSNPYIIMNGKEVFKYAVKSMTSVSELLMDRNSIKSEEIDWLVLHQANIRIIDSVAKKLGVSSDKVVVSVTDHANTSAATIPLALDSKFSLMKKNDLILISAVGAGFTWGSALIRL